MSLRKGSSEPEEAFEAYYARHFKDVARAVLPLADSKEEAFDIAQEAFLRTWAVWGQFADPAADPVRFTLRIGINLAISRLRRLLRLRRRLPQLHGPAQAASAEDIAGVRIDVFRALQKLTPRQRAAVVLCDGLGFSSAEAAATMNLADATVRVHLARGRERLRTAYAPDDFGHGPGRGGRRGPVEEVHDAS